MDATSTLTRLASLAVATLGLLLAGCGGASDPAWGAPPMSSLSPDKPRDAPQIAISLVGGRVGGILYVDRLRAHPAGLGLMGLGPARELVRGTSVDPLQDLERVFVTAPSANDPRAVMFAEHRLSPERVSEAIADLIEKSEPPGEMVLDCPYPAVRVQRKGRGGVVAFLPPRFVVAVPEDLVPQLSAFADTGGLPDPEGIEGARLFAKDPSQTLRARGVPRVPATVTHLDALVILRGDGGVSIDAEGQSSSPEQALSDASYLTEALDRATSVNLGIIKVRAFAPIVFEGKDDQIVSHTDLSPGEVDQILSLASSLVPR